MFSQPIIFVVGAGASAEFGLPAGGEMKKRLAKSLNFNRGPSGTIIGDREMFDMLGIMFGQQSGDRQNDATELATRIGEFESIDEALHWFSGRPETVAIGKAAIVREILQSERGSILFNESNPEIIPSKSYDRTWLPHFLSMLVSSLRREQSKELFRNVTLINFNYDRTIEHYLYSRLQTNFGFEAAEAAETIGTLQMIRPYGSIGALPWQNGNKVPYGDHIRMDHKKMFLLAQNVRTYTEQNLSHDLRSAIQSVMNAARLIVFLGFGFHQQNMTLLQATSGADWRRALATVLGIDPENFETMKIRIARTLCCSGPVRIQLLPRHAHQILPSMRPTLMATL
jgi:hypothetical protein